MMHCFGTVTPFITLLMVTYLSANDDGLDFFASKKRLNFFTSRSPLGEIVNVIILFEVTQLCSN